MRCKYESWENARFAFLEDEGVCPMTAYTDIIANNE